MRIKLIGCLVTKNEVMGMEIAAKMDCEFLDFSLHAFPNELHRELQHKINACQDYDVIILTYGNCSKAVTGLVSERVPIVLPRVQDCISLLLGSDRRRQQLAEKNLTAYYFSQGWLEYGRDPHAEYIEYVDEYGVEDAVYLIDAIYGQYREAVLIHTPCKRAKLELCRLRVKKIAAFLKWDVSEVQGDLGLLTAVLNRQQHPDVLWVGPGQPIILEVGETNEN